MIVSVLVQGLIVQLSKEKSGFKCSCGGEVKNESPGTRNEDKKEEITSSVTALPDSAVWAKGIQVRY